MPTLPQNSACARFHRSWLLAGDVDKVVPLDQHVARADRLREVDDGAISVAGIAAADLARVPAWSRRGPEPKCGGGPWKGWKAGETRRGEKGRDNRYMTVC